jgi:hypothetical protein
MNLPVYLNIFMNEETLTLAFDIYMNLLLVFLLELTSSFIVSLCGKRDQNQKYSIIVNESTPLPPACLSMVTDENEKSVRTINPNTEFDNDERLVLN